MFEAIFYPILTFIILAVGFFVGAAVAQLALTAVINVVAYLCCGIQAIFTNLGEIVIVGIVLFTVYIMSLFPAFWPVVIITTGLYLTHLNLNKGENN